MLGDWLARPGGVATSEIEALRRDIGARIIVRSIASVVLLLCTLATLWLQQRQLAIRRTLHQVKLLAHNILASLNAGVITTDQRGIITSINSAAIDLIGVDVDCDRPADRQHLHGRGAARGPVPGGQGAQEPRRRPRAGPGSSRPGPPSGGQRARAEGHARAATIGCVIHLRDVTERMLMKEQMWRMEQFASLSTLASGLLHEIKNPMTALSIHVQLLEERLRDDSADRQAAELIGDPEDRGPPAQQHPRELPDFASLDRLRLKPTDVQEVLEAVVRLIAPQAAAQGVRLDAASAPRQPLPRVELDPEKIEQAVLNLVLNALEAMPDGGDLTLGAAGRRRQAPRGGERHAVRAFRRRSRTTSSAPTFRPRGAGPAWAWPWPRSWSASTEASSTSGPVPRGRRFSITLPGERRATGARSCHEHRGLPHPDRRRRAEHPDRPGPGTRVRIVRDLHGQGRRRGACNCSDGIGHLLVLTDLKMPGSQLRHRPDPHASRTSGRRP